MGKTIAIIPARRNSKRLPNKNIKLLGGLPLLVRSINYAIANSSIIDEDLTKRYGVDTYKDIIIVDTLGFVSVKDSLFKTSNHYKNMMNVPVGEKGAKFKMQAGFLEQNNIKIPVFEAVVKKSVLLNDQSKDLIIQENQVVSVDGVNGDALKVGSMDEVNTNGNWPKTYGDNE